MRQRVNLAILRRVPINPTQTREGVLPINVHRARPTDPLPAGPPEGECGVNFVLDLDERIEDLWRLREMSVPRDEWGYS